MSTIRRRLFQGKCNKRNFKITSINTRNLLHGPRRLHHHRHGAGIVVGSHRADHSIVMRA
jgi:hypothetical protein